MFTGIVEETGVVERIKKGRNSAELTVKASYIMDDVKLGDSIAVNGVCLTVTGFDNHGFTADVMHETLNRSSLAYLKSGSRVNLERAMKADGRFGGHIVAGHVDGVGIISDITRDDNAIWYTVKAAPGVMRYIVEKGSIAIDGISLTVAKVMNDSFSISAIPHTLRETVLSDRQRGDRVNLENDVIGKYVEKLMRPANPVVEATEKNSVITEEFLTRYGF